MRVLHTSDWHVGRQLSRVSRIEESRAVLGEMAEIASREGVDAVVVCGDIFEHSSPSAEAEEVVYEALERLSDQGHSIVVVTGNHDHPMRWQALRPLLRRFNIFVAHDLLPKDEGGIIEVASRDGAQTLQVATVPWVSERRSFTAADLMGGTEASYKSYADAMSNAMASLCEGFTRGKCHMLAAHVFVDQSIVSESERRLTSGEVYAVMPHAIPASVQYCALGHVHMPQTAPNVSVPCRYSGSLLQLDFGEIGQQKSVTIVDLQPDLPAKLRQVSLTAGRRLIEVSGSLEELSRFENDIEGTFVRVNLTCDGPQPGLSDQVRELIPNALIVKLVYADKGVAEPVDARSKEPRELFEGYMVARYGIPASDELLHAFDALLAKVSATPTHAGQMELALDVAPAEDEQEREEPVDKSLVGAAEMSP